MIPIIIACCPLFFLQETQPADTSIHHTVMTEYNRYLAGESLTYDKKVDLARNLAHSNLWEEAIKLYTDLLADQPSDPDLLLGRGLVYAWNGRFMESEADLRAVTDQAPSYSDAWMALGNLYLWWEKPGEAEDAYSRWIALAPDRPDPLIARAKALQLVRDFPQARADLIHAQGLGGDPVEIDRLLREMDRIPSPLLWEPLLLHESVSFTNDFSDWTTTTLTVKRELATGSIAVGFARVARFDQMDGAGVLDGYLNLWRRSYGNLRINVAPQPDVLPKADVTLEVFQGVGTGWEFSTSYRYMAFSAVQVDIYGVSLAKYAGQWYLRGQLLAVPGEKGNELFAKAAARRYLGSVDDFLEVGAGAGGEVEYGPGEPLYSTMQVFMIRGQKFFRPKLGLTVAGSYQLSDDYNQLGLVLGAVTRF